jgi:hypothetical protein
VVNSTPRPALPPGKTGIHCLGGWVGPRAGLDGCGVIYVDFINFFSQNFDLLILHLCKYLCTNTNQEVANSVYTDNIQFYVFYVHLWYI